MVPICFRLVVWPRNWALSSLMPIASRTTWSKGLALRVHVVSTCGSVLARWQAYPMAVMTIHIIMYMAHISLPICLLMPLVAKCLLCAVIFDTTIMSCQPKGVETTFRFKKPLMPYRPQIRRPLFESSMVMYLHHSNSQHEPNASRLFDDGITSTNILLFDKSIALYAMNDSSILYEAMLYRV